MLAEDVVAIFRSDVRDKAKPYLWSDDEAYGYLTDAYLQLARHSGGVYDFVSDAAKVALTAGERLVDLHPAILRVISAFRVSDSKPVDVRNVEDYTLGAPGIDDYGTSSNKLLSDTPGQVNTLVLGVAQNQGLVLYTPEEDDELHLYIMRMPLVTVLAEGDEINEIPAHHQRALVLRMKELAYLKPDADTYDIKASNDAGGKFAAYCNTLETELARKKAKPRVVSYGGL